MRYDIGHFSLQNPQEKIPVLIAAIWSRIHRNYGDFSVGYNAIIATCGADDAGLLRHS